MGKHRVDLNVAVSMDDPQKKGGFTPLMLAASMKGERFVDFLKLLHPSDVENGVDTRLNSTGNDFHGFSAVEMAVDEFNQQVTNELLRLGADGSLAIKRIAEHKRAISNVYHEMIGVPKAGGWRMADTIWMFVCTLAFVFGAAFMAKKTKPVCEPERPQIIIEDDAKEPELKVSKRMRKRRSNEDMSC